jgi:predicted cobalt transporter CbtA
MTPELVGRLLMVLCGFALMFLGVITFFHGGEHFMLGILICFAGVVSMFQGLPHHE